MSKVAMLRSTALIGFLAMLGLVIAAGSPEAVPMRPAAQPSPTLASPTSAAPRPPPAVATNEASHTSGAIMHPIGFPGDSSCLQVRDLAITQRTVSGWTENDCETTIRGGEVSLQILAHDDQDVIQSPVIFVHDLSPKQWVAFDEDVEHYEIARAVRIARVEAF